MMLAVAIVALFLRVDRMLWLSAAYRKWARAYEQIVARESWRSPVILRPSGRIAWAGAMADKYRRAARHPWLPVEPDLPEPK